MYNCIACGHHLYTTDFSSKICLNTKCDRYGLTLSKISSMTNEELDSREEDDDFASPDDEA